ncbi:unnamed protein product [Rangifer tarandus platyrhynchus]|uniref:Uncharacterized protein n=3 Tax=Rangifer tarandus platyrhynchus TaxID=3082113 RepID=A0ABN8Y613_RANTA|nr:unnamed protein product [Rangifer tarandus platyrhynchus]
MVSSVCFARKHPAPWSGDVIPLRYSLLVIQASSCYHSRGRLLGCGREVRRCWQRSWKSPSCSVPASERVKAKKGTKLMVLQPLPKSPAKLVDPPSLLGSKVSVPPQVSFLFSFKRKYLFGSTGSQLQHLGSSLLQHVGSSSLTRDQTQAP